MEGRLRERIGTERRHAERLVTEAAYDAVRAQQLRAESSLRSDVAERGDGRGRRRKK